MCAHKKVSDTIVQEGSGVGRPVVSNRYLRDLGETSSVAGRCMGRNKSTRWHILNTMTSPCPFSAGNYEGSGSDWMNKPRFVTGIEAFDLQKSVLDRLIICFWSSWLLDFWRVKGQIAAAHSWSDDFSSSEVTLIPWSVPKGTLITWFNFDPGHKHFYMGHITYKWLYPLLSCQS